MIAGFLIQDDSLKDSLPILCLLYTTEYYKSLKQNTAFLKPFYVSKEFRSTEPNQFKVGDSINASNFVVGQFVDVSSNSIGKGFAGGMKRHNFSGQKASHGVHKVHRAGGSIGNASYPGHVFKGQKMAGRMGNEKSTIQSVTIVGLNEEKNYLLVNGSVPGNKGNIVKVQKAVKVKQ